MSKPRIWHGGYVSAYGIAVKHGFVGSEKEWLRSLCCEMRYNSEQKQIEYKPRNESEWVTFMSLADVQAGAVADTLAELQAAAKNAEADSAAAALSAASAATAAESAETSAANAGASASAAMASATLAEQHAAAAETSASLSATNAAAVSKNAADAAAAAASAAQSKAAAATSAGLASASAESVASIAEGVGKPNGIAQLDANGKVPTAQLPTMNYDAAGSAAAVQTALGTHAADATAHITAAERTAWNGKADLDTNGKVPASQLPTLGLSEADVQAMINTAIDGTIGGSY